MAASWPANREPDVDILLQITFAAKVDDSMTQPQNQMFSSMYVLVVRLVLICPLPRASSTRIYTDDIPDYFYYCFNYYSLVTPKKSI